jgi:ribosomal protein S8
MSNFIIGNFVNTLNVASRSHLKSINVENHFIIIKILDVLYKHGIISFFFFDKQKKKIRVHLKYFNNRFNSFTLQLISKPSCRVYNNLKKLSNYYNKNCFSQFYIIQHLEVY